MFPSSPTDLALVVPTPPPAHALNPLWSVSILYAYTHACESFGWYLTPLSTFPL